MKNKLIDATDKQILNELLKDGQATLKQIAERTGVTHGTVHMRLRRLRQNGVLKGTKALLDWGAVGYSMAAFVGITLHKARDCAAVLKRLHKVPEIVEAYYSTGKYNILVKILLRDVNELHHFLMNSLQEFKEIQGTETMVVLDAPLIRERPL